METTEINEPLLSQHKNKNAFVSNSSSHKFVGFCVSLALIGVVGYHLLVGTLEGSDVSASKNVIAYASATEAQPTEARISVAPALPTTQAKAKTSVKVINTAAALPKASPALPKVSAALPAVTSEVVAPSKGGLVGLPLGILPPHRQVYVVENGDFFMDILSRTHMSANTLNSILEAYKSVHPEVTIYPGQQITVRFDEVAGERVFRDLHMMVNDIDYVEVVATKDGIKGQKAALPTIEETRFVSASITSSLYQSAEKHGIPLGAIAKAIEILSYDVDFQRETRSGDKLSAVFTTTKNAETKEVLDGSLLMIGLEQSSRKLQYFLYKDDKGRGDFYDKAGRSARRSIVKTPVNAARISSGFGHRRHPILNFTRLHAGVDFAVPTGTPIYAAGDGSIEVIGDNKGYGNYVRIRHAGSYKTAYAHLSRFAKGMKKGKKVKQGQVIAYSGSTGLSTGPHLHYEVWQSGTPINPLKMKLPNSMKLKDKELASFQGQLKKIIAFLPLDAVQSVAQSSAK